MTIKLTERRLHTGLPYWSARGSSERWLAITHGSFGNHSEFVPFLDRLVQRVNVLLWDLPGHGQAANVAPARRLEDAARTLGEVMAAADVHRAHHIGYSLGGMVAQAFARTYPERTASLIAYGCIPVYHTKIPSRALARALVWLQHRTTPWNRFCATFAKQVTVDPELEEAFLQAMLPQSPKLRDAIWAAMLNSLRDEPEFQFACPVAQIVGARDDRFPGAQPAMIAWGETLPPDLRFVVPEAGHWVHGERPQAFEDALMTLLDRLDDRAAA